MAVCGRSISWNLSLDEAEDCAELLSERGELSAELVDGSVTSESKAAEEGRKETP
jgi:hypothetical protein